MHLSIEEVNSHLFPYIIPVMSNAFIDIKNIQSLKEEMLRLERKNKLINFLIIVASRVVYIQAEMLFIRRSTGRLEDKKHVIKNNFLSARVNMLSSAKIKREFLQSQFIAVL